MVGEGNGRFLAEFVRAYPHAEVDCIEASARMIALARERVGNARVRFACAQIRDLSLPEDSYDLVVAHFFLDCFSRKTLTEIVAKLARSATATGQWLIADFCEPARGWKRFRAHSLITIMYLFFRLVAEIEARRLVDYRALLQTEGFVLERDLILPNEMIRSELWQRGGSG